MAENTSDYMWKPRVRGNLLAQYDMDELLDKIYRKWENLVMQFFLGEIKFPLEEVL